MDLVDLNLVRAFAAVHETGSFSAAAARLGVPRSTVSRAVAALETALDVRLFHRTTRRVSTSTAGLALYERSAAPLRALERSLGDMPEREEEPSGALRVASTADLGAAVVAEANARFTARYPGTTVEAHLSNELVDLVQGGFDIALRIPQRPMRDSSLVARRVGTIVIQLYASPAYLARRGAPRGPADLAAHDGVSFRGVPTALQGSGRHRPPGTRVRITCDDMFFAREALKAGGGVGALPAFVAAADVAAGLLVHVLPRWVVHRGPVYLVQPERRHQARKVAAFGAIVAELLRQRLG